MKNRILCLLIMLGFGVQANATVISFSPSESNVGIGNQTSVDLVISGLGADILTAFDLFVLYDDTLLQFDGFEFGSDCGGFSCLDVLGFGSLQDVVDLGGGEVEVFELSFDFDTDLMDLQPNAFVLGTFTFTGLESGISALELSFGLLAGAFDDNTGFPTDLAFDFEAGSIKVPEPATWLLLMSGLLGLRMMGRRKAVRA